MLLMECKSKVFRYKDLIRCFPKGINDNICSSRTYGFLFPEHRSPRIREYYVESEESIHALRVKLK